MQNKFIEELKQRETLNKKNIEQIEKDLIDCAQNMIRSKVEEYNNNVNQSPKTNQKLTNFTSKIQDIHPMKEGKNGISQEDEILLKKTFNYYLFKNNYYYSHFHYYSLKKNFWR